MKRILICLLVGLLSLNCNSSGTSTDSSSTTSTPLTTSQKTTAHSALSGALINIFSSAASGNDSSKSLVRYSTTSCDSNDPGCTCESIRGGETPIFVKASPLGVAGSYGSSNDSITLSASDFCNDTSGNENSGSGPDSNGLFGAFEIRQDLESTCDSDTVTLGDGSSGVFRNDSSGNVTLYGTFALTMGSSSSSLDCTITFTSDGELSSADCTDAAGTTIEADSSDSCSLSITEKQTTIGACDVLGNPTLGIYDVSTTSTDYERTFIEGQLDQYEDLIEFIRPHRVNGHVFSYNVVDEDFDGNYDWNATDDVVKLAQDHNYRLFVNVYPEADDGEHDDSEYGVKIIELPSDTAGYAAFVQAMVERYDGDGYNDYSDLEIPVKHWAVANEPYCDTTDSDCHADILELLELTYDAVKAADPDAIVFMGGGAPLYDPNGVDTSDEVETLYQYIFDNGGLDHMDKLAFHTAVGREDPSIETYVIKYNDMMGSDAVPLWLTETGSRDVGDEDIVFDSDSATEYSEWESYIEAGLDVDGLEKAFLCNIDGLYDDSTFWTSFETWLEDL